MQITLQQIGKKFQREWIFRDISLTFQENQTYALIGPNGSGKSTLLLILSGLLPPSRGEILYHHQGQLIEAENVYRHQAIAAPYVELIEEFTLRELLDFHFALKSPLPTLTTAAILQKLQLEQAKHKYIHQFSSGMKQRLKLGLAFYTDADLIFLDEPCSNLDKSGTGWYYDEIKALLGKKLMIISSNQPYEYQFCDTFVDIVRYK